MTPTNTDHIIIETGNHRMHCTHCGNVEPLHLPMPVYLVAALATAYIEHHKDCEKEETSP